MTLTMNALRNIAIIAHVDHGKTTLVDQLLRQSGTLGAHTRMPDRVMDSNQLERERGITILAKNTAIKYRDVTLNIIDTPGHVDFTAEVERSLRVLDGGVVVFDAVAGVQPQSETVWRQADKYHVPRICFINKMDKVGGDYYKATETIVERLKGNPVPIQIPMGAEDNFSGVIDLVTGNTFTYDGDSGEYQEGEMPEE